MPLTETFDWAKIVGPVLGAIVGASLTYFFARGGRRALAYFPWKNVVVISPELFMGHAITIHSGGRLVSGWVFLTALRVKNIGINGIASALVRITPKLPNVEIISVGIRTSSTLLAERTMIVESATPGAQSFEIRSMAAGDFADFNILIGANEKLESFDKAMKLELEADGKLGRESSWLRFLYDMTPRRKRDEGVPVRPRADFQRS
jgi:hypothetical protein